MSRCRCSSVFRSDWSFARSVDSVSDVAAGSSVLVQCILQFKNFFKEVGGRRIPNLFHRSGFQIEEILSPLDRVTERPVRGIQQGGIAEADGLFGSALVLIEIGMECAAQFVEFGFQLALVDREAAGEAQAGEVIEFFRNRLDLDASVTEVFTGHFRLAVPAHAASHLQLTWAGCAMVCDGPSAYLF